MEKKIGDLLKFEKLTLQKKNQILERITLLIERNKKPASELEGTLSCLSCLEYLKDPLTLICGHSICMKCFKTHSDPNAKDSAVFCEECKIETKNKVLKSFNFRKFTTLAN